MIISYPFSSMPASKCCSSLLLKITFRGSRSQLFFKIGIPKNVAIFTGKKLCRNFLLKRDPTHVFSYEHCKILKNSFFSPPVDVSGHLHYFLILLFLTFSSSSFFLLCSPVAVEWHVSPSVLIFLVKMIMNIQKKTHNTN